MILGGNNASRLAGQQYVEFINTVVTLTSDPRSGTGYAGTPGQVAYDGTYYYHCVGTGVNDWIITPWFTSSTLAAAATTVTFSGLDGDKAITYRLDFDITCVAGGQSFSLLINGATTNVGGTYITFQGNGNQSGTGNNGAVIGNTYGDAGTRMIGHLIVYCAGRRLRRWESFSHHILAATSPYQGRMVQGYWNDTTNNVTSIAIQSSVALDMAIGSTFKLSQVIGVR